MAELTVQQSLKIAKAHHEAGRLQQAQMLYREVLLREPGNGEALTLQGIAAAQSGHIDLAIALLRQGVAANPNSAEANYNLGNALVAKGATDDALTAYQQAITLKPDWAEAHNNLGIVLKNRHRNAEAIVAYLQAIKLKPDWPEVHNNLGNALKDTGQLDAGIVAYRRAIFLNPRFAEAYNNLGVALRESGQWEQSISACKQAIVLKPNFPEAHNNLGVVLEEIGQMDQAATAYRQAIGLDPKYAQAHYNFGNACKDMGQTDQAIVAYRHALSLRPRFLEAHNNLIYTMHFDPSSDGRAIAQEQQRWHREHVEPLQLEFRSSSNDANTHRRLKVGYVSPDFRRHAESFFVAPLLREHNHELFEIHCYCSARRADDVTATLKGYADAWHDVGADSDAQLAERIRADGIDILVDLTMHMSHNRLLTFARKPAPVQVTWLAYPGGTGLAAMDYRFTDAFIDPPTVHDYFHTEKPMILPDCWCCYDPLCAPITIDPLPGIALGYITFGSLNNFCKINPNVLNLWASILQMFPKSRLLLLAPESGPRQRTLDQLQAKGINPARVAFVSRCQREQYLQLYQHIDIALDPFPYNGITTTCDALWMGVPVLSLKGTTAAARAGWGLLSTVGLDELVADTSEQLIHIAAGLAGDLAKLQQLRSTLRDRLEHSPLMDAPRFALNVETAYRLMWQTWCQTR